jgi:hypothetical protein
MHGRRLDIENCSLDQLRARTEFETTRTRNRIALVVVVGALAALALAFVYGLWAGSMAYVGYVWGVAAPIAAGVIGFYFRRDSKELP